ncbi:hypothetical protein MLD38_013308 [Melastoma candidum]|uniref:Uncharacterized protein n=1 Tax=Melastoma candidum TaxID=119954 RepID=A0ACB9RHM3_9MYRT|nr:hypothetical protein MLD38_013308 [Melastoma candidum]
MDQKPLFTRRKLALWYTRNFKPIFTHRELEPIMANLGFVGLPLSVPGFGTPWKEYVYRAGTTRRGRSMDSSRPCPRLRLPHPRIDGLHIKAYEAFLDAVNFYVKMNDISLIFHVRGMPIRQADAYAKWRYMDGDESFYLYREGTADQIVRAPSPDKGKRKKDEDDDLDGWIIGSKNGSSQSFHMVPYSDIVVQETMD